MGGDDRLKTKNVSLDEVRRYHPQDVDELLSVWESATRLAHPFMGDEFIAEERKAIAEQYLPNTVTNIAMVDGKIAGFISMIENEVGAIFVDPPYHGHGVGRALMDVPAAIHAMLEVDVFAKNALGRGFYKKYGFEEISRRNFDRLDEEVIRMRWTASG